MKDWNVPLYRAVRKYSDSDPTPFHMPGHKLGKGLPQEFLQDIAKLDITEIQGTDNLHYPKGPIKEAQILAAEAYGAKYTYFLVNGSTCGVMATILTLCSPGDEIIVGRDCHKSVLNGIILAGAHPVYITPEFNYDFGISTVITPSAVKEALDKHPDAVGVFITRPNYYGICCDIEGISKVVHSHKKILAVDEAHGAHLSFSEKLPGSAVKSGADICVQSAHKTLPAFTQGAYLHVGSAEVDLQRLEFNLRILQTTSPSYIIMVMLDIARETMVRDGKELIDGLLHRVRAFRESMNKIENIRMLSKDNICSGMHDETRIVINFRKLGKTGFEIEEILRNKYNIQVEMADFYNIVCIATIADNKDNFEKLCHSILEIDKRYKGFPYLSDNIIREMEIPHQVLEPKDAVRASGVMVPLDRAAGRICRETITPYPPGIPVICPGEIISTDTAEYIYSIINAGGIVNGLWPNGEVCVVG